MARFVHGKTSKSNGVVGNGKGKQAMYEGMIAIASCRSLHFFHKVKSILVARGPYIINSNVDESMSRYTTWLIAKEYAPTNNIDYDRTFNFIFKMAKVWTIIRVVA